MTDTVSDAMQEPQRVRTDGVTVQSHDLDDLIKADQYVADKAASNKRKLPIRLMRIKPGGPV